MLALVGTLLGAVLAGGGVALFLARSNKDLLNATASKVAVETVQIAINTAREQLKQAERRITALEASLRDADEVRRACDARIVALEETIHSRDGFEGRIESLRAEVERLGGDVEEINHVADSAD